MKCSWRSMGIRMLNYEFWFLNFDFWILGFEFWILGLNFYALIRDSRITYNFLFSLPTLFLCMKTIARKTAKEIKMQRLNDELWMMNFDFWILNFGFWILNFGFEFLRLDSWLTNHLQLLIFFAHFVSLRETIARKTAKEIKMQRLNYELWMLIIKFWLLNFEFWILNFEFWILNFEFFTPWFVAHKSLTIVCLTCFMNRKTGLKKLISKKINHKKN